METGKGKVALKDNYYSSKNDTPYYGVERELKEGVYIIKIENPSNIEYNSLYKLENNSEKDLEESLENQNTIKNTILNFGKNMEYPTVIGKKSDDEPVSLSRYIGIDDIKDSIITNNKGDVVFMYSKFLLGGKKNEKDITKPYISPVYGVYNDFPRTLIQVGDHEVLLDDSKIIYEKMKKAGVDVRIDVYDRMFHVFQILPFLEESKQSYKIIGEFLDETFISD